MYRTMLFGAMLVLLAGCGSAASEPTTTGSATTPSTATTVDGPFEVNFALSQSRYTESDQITGTAMLSIRGGPDAKIWASGQGPFAYSFVEVNGSRRMEAVYPGDCAAFTIRPQVPLTSALAKSGGWTAEDPNAAFYEGFFADPSIHLPAGTWDIKAQALFNEASPNEGECRGRQRNIITTVQVEIVP